MGPSSASPIRLAIVVILVGGGGDNLEIGMAGMEGMAVIAGIVDRAMERVILLAASLFRFRFRFDGRLPGSSCQLRSWTLWNAPLRDCGGG